MIALVPLAQAAQEAETFLESDSKELPEMDMTGLHTNIELIEIDPDITNATQNWMLLAHDAAGKEALIGDIESSTLSVAEKNTMKKSIQNIWDKYPTKFEDAGQKYIDIKVQSDDSNRTISIPVGHITRITFDQKKIEQVAKDKKDTRVMRIIQDKSKGAKLTLFETENQTIRNITNLRAKKITNQKTSDLKQISYIKSSGTGTKNSYPSGLSSSSHSYVRTGFSSSFGDEQKNLNAGLMAWGGSHSYLDDIPIEKIEYKGHNSYAYYAALKASFSPSDSDTAAMAAMYPDDIIDNIQVPDPFSPQQKQAINLLYHSYYHYWNPIFFFGLGGAPGRCNYYTLIAKGYSNPPIQDPVSVATNFGYASHYLTDVGNPMHTGREVDQKYDIDAGYNTHEKYEYYVSNNSGNSPSGAPYNNIIRDNPFYYSVTDPEQATKNLATFSNTYLDTLYYRIRNNPNGDNPAYGFPTDPTVRLITENCVNVSARYSLGLAKYVKGDSTSNAPPAADFIYHIFSYDGSSATIVFTDKTIGQVDFRDWDFGDNGPHQYDTIVYHTYYPWNDYRAKLTVTNSFGTTTKTMDIPANHIPPSPSFIATHVIHLTYQFTDNSVGANPDCYPTSWYWDFGDGTVFNTTDLNQKNPQHTFPGLGRYTVTLITKNIYGNSQTNQVVWPPTPIESAFISQIDQNDPFTVLFTDQSSNGYEQQYPLSYQWTFGDGSTSTEKNPTHTYLSAGTYTVRETVNRSGWNDIDFMELPIEIPGTLYPIADFTATPTSGTAPLTVQFNDTSPNSPTAWAWDYGDGNTSSEQSPTHEYAFAGTFHVSLTATNSGGSNTSQKSNYITVTVPAPVANFTATPTTSRALIAVQFNDTSTNSPTSWAWDFGDGQISSIQNPSHIYTNPGMYTVGLTATNSGGSNTTVRSNYITVVPTGIVGVSSGYIEQPGEETVLSLSLDNAPIGLSGYNVNVSLSNSTVAQITSVSFPSWASTMNSVTVLPATQNVMIKASDVNLLVGTGAVNIELTNITVKGLAPGQTSVVLTSPNIDDDNGYDILHTLANGNLVVDFPLTDPAIYDITPSYGYATGSVTVSLNGTGFRSGPTVRLTRSGQSDIYGTSIDFRSRYRVNCTFDLTGRQPGAWNVVLVNRDNKTATLVNGFTVV
jgi:PKD repeat protein